MIYSHDEIEKMDDRLPCEDWPRAVATLKFLSAALMGQFNETAMTDTAALCRLATLLRDAERTTSLVLRAFGDRDTRQLLDELTASVAVVGATLTAYDVRARSLRDHESEEDRKGGVRKTNPHSTRR